MTTKNFATPNAVNQARKWGIMVAAVNLIGGVTILSGCGGGGGGTTPSPTPTPAASPTPTPTPIPTPTPSPLVSPTPTPTPSPAGNAKDRAIAANFLPNYIPAAPERYLHWANNKTLRVFIQPSINNVFDKTPVTNIDPARAQSAVREAIDSWTAASTSDFQFTLVDSADKADIQIYFVNELRRLDGSFAAGVGLANYGFTYPNPEDKMHAILDNANVQIVASQPDVNLPDTIAHEVGHALGIEKHSEDSNDLLFATTFPPVTITQRDQNTLFFLYYSPTALGGSRSVATSNQKSPIHTSEIVCNVK